jgi:IPT/TIG domain
MGRSQRHMLIEQSTTAAGEIHAQGEVAPGIAMQVDPTQLNVMQPGPTRGYVVATQDIKEGEGGVEVPVGEYGGPLKGSSLTGAIPESLEPPPEPPEPVEDVAPVLTSLAPADGPIQTGDLTVRITGTGFTVGSVMLWNGADDVCAYVSETELTTIVKTDLASGPSTCAVAVRNGDQVSNELTFELVDGTPEARAAGGRAFPIGPSNIGLITDHGNGIEIGLIDALDVQVGDTVQIEATFNASVNGTFQVLSINPIVINNDIVLDAPIENKGRLTVTVGA